jgi:hypothetical protein
MEVMRAGGAALPLKGGGTPGEGVRQSRRLQHRGERSGQGEGAMELTGRQRIE